MAGQTHNAVSYYTTRIPILHYPYQVARTRTEMHTGCVFYFELLASREVN